MAQMEQRKWNFDEIIERRDTQSVKWNAQFLNIIFKREDLLPLWVADMDFRAPPALIAALEKRVAHGIFGYNFAGPKYRDAVINWFKRRFNWQIDPSWIQFTPGIVPAINILIQTFTKPGDRVIIQEPVYYPFSEAIRNNGRIISVNELHYENGRYRMDFEDLEKKINEARAKMLIFCSPHNPVSRVWTREELEHLATIVIKHDILLVSDEIHCDLIMPGHTHIPIASLSDEIASRTITCTAGSKSFNIAGLNTSNLIISNEILRKEFATSMANLAILGPTIFGAVALETVYNECEDWLDAVLDYIYKNYLFLCDFVKRHWPRVLVLPLEGTYLAWLDFSGMGCPAERINECIMDGAKIALDRGEMFGKGGTGFQRINLACPRKTLEECMERINMAFQSI